MLRDNVGQPLNGTYLMTLRFIDVAGGGFFYLVTAENRLTEEGTKGFSSEGAERGGGICP